MKYTIKAVCAVFLLAVIAAFGSLGVRAESGAEQEPLARKVKLQATLNGKKDDSFNGFLDGSVYSYYLAKDEICFRFAADEPVSGIYLIFNAPCDWRILLPDGGRIDGGVNRFIHQYIKLDKSYNTFDLELEKGCKLADIYALTDGALPDWVQNWEPPCEKADLLVLPTHSDDEHLWFGGALPYYAGELGYKVQVVYMTNHFNVNYRGHEALNGLWKVGVRNYPIISEEFTDHVYTKYSLESAEAAYGRENVIRFQVEILRRFAPKVVIAHDIKGEYGHGAHILNAQTLLEALKIYDDPTVYPESAGKYGITKVQKVYLHLWKENQIVVNWSQKKLSRFGGKTALDMAREGFDCHRSQLEFDLAVNEYGPFDCRQFGLAYTTVGNDTPGQNDMFENVDWTEPEETPGSGEVTDEAADDVREVSPADAEAKAEEDAKDPDVGWLPAIWMISCPAVIAAAAAAFYAVKRRKKNKTDCSDNDDKDGDKDEDPQEE